ncbi:MAG TPA: carbohydrate kinase family protein [Firmicutes bacterium]|nr:carbohydrate kinase family protein [Bacillota bacterium]HHY98316.1 carbohydrate kinase family protein [Bacillota bacterium]
MREFDVIVVGELNADIIMRLDSPPEPGKEVLATDSLITLGSSSAICAVGLARLGLGVKFIGFVGDDDLGRFILRRLHGEGIEVEDVEIAKGEKTGFTVSLVHGGDRALVTEPGVMRKFDLKDEDFPKLSSARHLHISSPFLQESLRTATILREAKVRGLSTSLDPGWDPLDSRWDSLKPAFQHIDILLMNQVELERFSKGKGIGAIELPRRVIVKLGSMGSTGRWDGETVSQPAFPVAPVDTTGAGDSFNAGFLYAFLNGYDVQEAMRFGNACGALSCMALGGTEGFPRLDQVLKFLGK